MTEFIYTDEMKEQDKLWLNGKENKEVMIKLHIDICKRASENGHEDSVFYIDVSGDEIVTYIFDSEEEQIEYHETKESDKDSYATCKQLIKAIMDKVLVNLSKEVN